MKEVNEFIDTRYEKIMGYLSLLKKTGIRTEKHSQSLMKIESYLNDIVEKVSGCISCTDAKRKIEDIRNSILDVRNSKYETPTLKSSNYTSNENKTNVTSKTLTPKEKKTDEKPYIVKQRSSDEIIEKKREIVFADFTKYLASLPNDVMEKNFREIKGIMGKVVAEDTSYAERLIGNFKSLHKISNAEIPQIKENQLKFQKKFKNAKIRKLGEIFPEVKAKLKKFEDYIENLSDNSKTNNLVLSLKDLEQTIKNVHPIAEDNVSKIEQDKSPQIDAETSVDKLIDDLDFPDQDNSKIETEDYEDDSEKIKYLKEYSEDYFRRFQESIISLNATKTLENIDEIIEMMHPYTNAHYEDQKDLIHSKRNSLFGSLKVVGKCYPSRILSATEDIFSTISKFLKEKTKSEIKSEQIKEKYWRVYDGEYHSWIAGNKEEMKKKLEVNCNKATSSFRLKEIEKDIDDALAMN